MRADRHSKLRRLLRTGFYQFPVQWQMRLKSAKRSALGEYDWPGPTKELRIREEDYIVETATRNATLPDRKRIAIYSLHHFSPVEYGLAMALRLRGHDVRGVLCDGVLPLCEMSLGPVTRQPCETCIASLSRNEDAFGFEYERLSAFLDASDRARAEEIVSRTPDDELPGLIVDGVPVGRLGRRELQRYYRGFVFDPPRDPAYRSWIVTAILCTWLSQRWLEKHRPDILGVCSGRTLTTACVFEVARQRGIRVVTWDGTATFPDTLMFSHDRPATEVPLDDAWERVSNDELSRADAEKLEHHLRRWSRSENTPFPYNLSPVENESEIRSALSLRPEAPLVVAFTNAGWDISVIDRDVGFDSMFDWLFSLVEYARDHPAVDVVVRAHPAETNVPPDLRTGTPVAGEIRRRFDPLPPNVKLVEGNSPLSSYTLAGMAAVNMVYASRLGLEIAMRGKRPWIAGAVTYRHKGFTLDLSSKAHMLELLDQGPVAEKLDDDHVDLAKRFAFLWFFRYEVRLPLLRAPGGRFSLDSFRQLGPQGDPTLSMICDAFVSGEPFLDFSRRVEDSAAVAFPA